jgi:DHA1 family inner membrane transport protein
MKFNPGLMALSIGAFGIGVTEFAPMGLLPAIASDVHVSIPRAGLLISAYAIGVMIGAPLVTLSTGRMARRTLLILLAAIFTAGNLLAAISSSYAMLLAARLLTSLSHGAFFGVGSVVAGSLVSAERRASAVAAMFMGLTIANIGGVPLATWAGEHVGWRAAFWGMSAVGIVTMAALRSTLPVLPAPKGGNAIAELRVLARSRVLGALGLTTLCATSMFTVFTYITPILRGQTGGSIGFVTAMLLLIGIGLSVGNWLGGRFADRSVDRTLMTALAALVMILVAFAALMPFKAPTVLLVFLWSAASFAVVPPLQVRVMQNAQDAPNLAAAMNVGAFNLGNAIGAALGGGVIVAGLGYPTVALAGAAAAASGLVAVLLSTRYRARAAETAR